MKLSIIVAIGKNNEIGKDNSLLWHIPADMKHFREITEGHTVVMGRKTFESIGKALPKRRNLIITRDKNYKITEAEIAYSLEDALSKIKNDDEVFIIGGAQIYKQALPLADKLYITHVQIEDKDADSFFPEIIPILWNEVSHEEHKSDEKNKFAYIFSIYEKFI
jgi:dihydrofolate reductase